MSTCGRSVLHCRPISNDAHDSALSYGGPSPFPDLFDEDLFPYIGFMTRRRFTAEVESSRLGSTIGDRKDERVLKCAFRFRGCCLQRFRYKQETQWQRHEIGHIHTRRSSSVDDQILQAMNRHNLLFLSTWTTRNQYYDFNMWVGRLMPPKDFYELNEYDMLKILIRVKELMSYDLLRILRRDKKSQDKQIESLDKGHLAAMTSGFHVRTNGTRTSTLKMEDLRKRFVMDFSSIQHCLSAIRARLDLGHGN